MSPNSPLVTIITPTYNSALYLSETVASVLNQTYHNLEYIILDDGSDDNTQDLLASYNDPRMRKLRHDNIGQEATINRGYRLATGDYICVLSSDDVFLVNYIQVAVEFMEANPDILLGYPRWMVIDEESNWLYEYPTLEYSYRDMIRWHKCLPGLAVIMRRHCLELEPERDPRYKYIGDFEYFVRLGLHGDFKRIPHIGGGFRYHANSITYDSAGNTGALENRIQMINELFARPDLPKDIRKLKCQAYSNAYYIGAVIFQAEPKLARKYLFCAFFFCFFCRPKGEAARSLRFMAKLLIPSRVKRLYYIVRNKLRKVIGG